MLQIGNMCKDHDMHAAAQVRGAQGSKAGRRGRAVSAAGDESRGGGGSGKEGVGYTEDEVALACAALKCALTGRAMRDPVIAPDGYSYERRAAIAHFERTRKSPVTNEMLPFTDCIPNNQLRSVLEAHKRCMTKLRRASGTEHNASAVDYTGAWLPRIKQELKCPITMSRMCDAVVTCDGHSYERESIVRWLRRHGTSPKSNIVLSSKALITNRNVSLLASLVRDVDDDGGGEDDG